MATPKFRPYRGLEEKIKSFPQQPGYVYFATDTGRIYLDYEGQRLAMGGNGASLYYANDEDVTQDLLDNYFIDVDTILEAGPNLKANDLIINSDGAFYRVIEVLEDEGTVKCTRIAVSGTGGGGTGGGPGDNTPQKITLELVGSFPTTFVYGKKTEVTFKSVAELDAYVRYNVVIQGNNDKKILNYDILSGEEFIFDVGSELFQGNNTIVVTAFGDNSGQAVLKYPYRESVVFGLKKDPEFNPKLVREGSITFSCIPIGTTAKTLELYVDGTLAITENIGSGISDSIYRIDLPAQSHGAHTVDAILKATVGGAYVETDPISYQIAWNDGITNTPIIWFPEEYPNAIIQYEDYILEYMVWHPERTTEIETHFRKRDVELPSSPRLLNYDSTSIQKWNITDYDIGTNSYTIIVENISRTVGFEVTPDETRDLEILKGGLVLNLDSIGRSNEENISSKTTWVSKTTNPVAVQFNNFNWYNNGWFEDEKGRSCLRISNGASISIPINTLGILNSATMSEALTLEFRFKVRNIREYATLIETTSTENEKGEVIIEKQVHTEKGVIGQLFGNNIGMCIGTQEAFIKSSNTIVNARYRDEEIISLAFVIEANSSMSLLYIYLQGILSGIAKYGASDNFNSASQAITFNSEYCDIDLYNVRAYKAKLGSADIVHNYIADLKDVKSYDANQIVTTVNQVPTIDYKLMLNYNEKHPDETIIPYMVIESRDSDNKLPYVKGGKKAVNIEFHNPALDYAYKKGYITADKYLHSAPSFSFTSGEKSLDVQGTSSQGYPRRNYKWKAKQKDATWRYLNGPLLGYPIYEYDALNDKYVGQELDGKSYKKYYLDSEIGETTFCLKADYMESSGTHNTGYASYVSKLYSKHPLKDYFPKATLPSSLRTTVYGFPILVFQKTGADSYEFVGRYNFNLDKGATDTCGFTYEADSFVKDENGAAIPLEEIAECWEIKNNQGQRTSFVKVDFEETTDAYSEVEITLDTFEPDKYYYISHINTSSGAETYELAKEYDANKTYYTKQSGVLSLLEDFEYRYSAFEDEIDHAIEGTDEFANKTQEERNEAILYRMRNLKEMAIWLESTDVSVPEKLGMRFGKYTEVPLTANTFIQGTHYAWDNEYKIWKPTYITTAYDPSKLYAVLNPETKEYEEVSITQDSFIPGVHYMADAWAPTIAGHPYRANNRYALYDANSGVYNEVAITESEYEYGTHYVSTWNLTPPYAVFDESKEYASYDEDNNKFIKVSLTADTFKPGVHYVASDWELSVEPTAFSSFNRYSLYDESTGKYNVVVISAETFEPGTHFVSSSWEITKSGTEFDPLTKYATCEPEPIVLGGVTYRFDDKQYRLAKFRVEFQDHFDQEYCEVYFIMTELLHLYDSRGKNCMLATWGPRENGTNYIWYPIFYDIDTQLGINNSGVPTWDYDVNPTEENMFSTSNGVLWNNLWSVFSSSIKSRYIDLRKNALNIDGMDGYYNSHPILGRGDIDTWKNIEVDAEGMASLKPKINSFAKIGKKPVMLYNVDQYYKYIAPATTGYINTSGGTSTTSTFFYCLQGSRELMRYLYLRNRLNFLDSQWHAGAYSSQGALGHLKIRYDANLLNSTSDAFLYTSDPDEHGTLKEMKDSQTQDVIGNYTMWNWDLYGPHPLDCTVDFQGVRSFLVQYMSLQADDGIYAPVRCNGYDPVTLNVASKIQRSIKTQPALTQQLVYLGGGEYIADLGDLGLKYLDEFVATTLKRLTSLRLGSDVPGYFNNQLNSSNCQIGAHAYNIDGKPNPEAKALLEEIVLTGLTGLDGELDVSGSEKLKTLRALRTILTSVNLAEGVQIETLHLPNTITNITLTEPVALRGILNNPGSLESGFNKGLYIEGITNSNGDYSKDIMIDKYAITGGSMGYDSYKLLDILVNFKKAMIDRNSEKSKELSINLKEVNWSPYELVEYGEPYYAEKASLYFVDNQRFALEPYTYEESTWEFYTKNERLYMLNTALANDENNTIVDLNILDTFITSYEEALEYYNNNGNSTIKNYFKSATSLQPISMPEITGIIYINNAVAEKEDRIANYYNTHFPKLKFFFKNVDKAHTSLFVTSIDGIETIIYSERKSKNSEDLSITYPDPKKYTPFRLNYDFVGWSLNKEANPESEEVYHHLLTENFETKWSEMKYSTSPESYKKFYAIFDSTKYKVYFKNYYQDGRIETIATEDVVAGEYLYPPNVLPSTDESALKDDERYKLLGWVAETKYCFPENEIEGKKHLVNLSNTISENGEKTFYACYVKENVLDSVTDARFFNFWPITYTDNYDSSYDITGYFCGAATNVQLAGKITIPGTYNDLPVIGVDGITNQQSLTHIYFKNPETVRVIGEINKNPILKVFKFPIGLRVARASGQRAGFKENPSLIFDTESFAACRLARIESNNYFSSSFDLTKGGIELLQLPGTLRYMTTYTFYALGAVGKTPPEGDYVIREVRFGGPNDPSQFDINSVNSGASLFLQRPLPSAPVDHPSASTNTPIKTYTYYRDPTKSFPDHNAFRAFCDGDKVSEKNDILDTVVVDADVSLD